MTDSQGKIKVYGTSWCYDSRRARMILDNNNIAYDWIDIDQDAEGRQYVESVNRGYRSVPTILFPDGSLLIEPSNTVLSKKLGLP